MASSQQPLGSNQFSEKEKVAIDEAVKEAQSMLANNIKNAKASQDQQVALVTGVMKNLQGRGLLLNKSHVWKGNFLTGPPEKIGESGAFVHEGAAPQVGIPMAEGSKAVVIYAHYDKALPQLGWLLAWDKSVLLTNKFDKVYVEAGDLSRLSNMEMDEIEKKLDASHSVSRYWDSDTGAAAAAQMSSYANNMVLVGATFDRIM